MWIDVQTAWAKCGEVRGSLYMVYSFFFLSLSFFSFFISLGVNYGQALRKRGGKGGLFQCARYLHIIYLYLRGNDARVRISLADRSQMSVHGPGLAGRHARQPYLLCLPKPSRMLGAAGCGLRGYWRG